MYHFLETFKLENGCCLHADRHYQRIQENCLYYYKKEKDLGAIRDFFRKEELSRGSRKISIRYNEREEHIQDSIYVIPKLNKLVLRYDDSIDYSRKYADRSLLEYHRQQSGDGNDCIIVKNGWLSDSSFSNLTFKKGERWFTPAHPLLNGIKRQLLIEEGLITVADIRREDLPGFEYVSLINSMLDPGDLQLSVSDIMKPVL